MSTLLVHRRPRRRVEEVGAGDPGPVALSSPPPLADASGASSWTYALFPVLGSVGMLVIALVNRNPLFLIAGGVFVLGSIGMGVAMFVQMRGRTQAQRFDTRGRYFAHLASVRDQLGEAARHQRERARTAHPGPGALLALVTDGDRVWERRPGDADFLHLRVGTGSVPALGAPSLRGADPTASPDPAAQDAAQRMVEANGWLDDVPVALPLRPGTTTLVGSAEDVRGLARAMLAELAALHAPDDVRLAVATPLQDQHRWAHLKWLPHVRHPAPPEGCAGADEPLLLADGPHALAELLDAELDRRRRSAVQRGTTTPSAAAAGPALVVLVDGSVGPGDPFADADELGVVVLRLVHSGAVEPAHVALTVTLAAGGSGTEVAFVPRIQDGDPPPRAHEVRPDALSLPAADAVARALAPRQLSRQVGEASLSEVSDLPRLLGIDDVGMVDPAVTWRRRSERALLRVPLGVDADGRPVELDLKESALDGMGPHGLAVGATGSGKSELLRTLVTGLALTHSPEDLALVLVDFKGGATFAGLRDLPHLAGSITDLEDDPGTVERMTAALRGELRRRERVLRDSGDLASIREHRQARLSGADVPALPHLLVVIDEFSELLAQQPDLIELFVTIGRLGRSLGVHLLLATQRLEEGKLKGLDSHLSYRLALRTFSAAESRSVIGNADAYELPPVPGSAYLKVDTSVYQRMRVATVSAPYTVPPPAAARTAPTPARVFDAFGAGAGDEQSRLPALGLDLSDPGQRSTMAVAVDRLAGAADQVAPVWTAPLPPALPLAAVLGPLRRWGAGDAAQRATRGPMSATVGVVDLPEQQRTEPFTLDLASSGGHLGVVGAPQSGKSTLLRTLVASLAMTHRPEQLQVYCLDLGGGGLSDLEAFPHVGGVATRRRPDLMRRTVAQLGALLDAREEWFAEHGLESVADLRALRALRARGADGDGDGPDGDVGGRADGSEEPAVGDGYGDVVLVVDGWAVLRSEHEDLEQAITGLTTRGAAYGLHVVIATPRWFDLRPALKDALGAKVEMRLGDPADSVFTRAAARSMPTATPGRMLTAGDRRVQVALPQPAVPGPDGEPVVVSLADAGRAVSAAVGGAGAPPVLLLPERVDVGDLPPARPGEAGVAIGVRERDLGPARVDLLGTDPHLLVMGDSRSGRTAALRTLIAQTTARHGPEELRVVVVDYRRGLLDAVGEDHLSTYCASAPAAAEALGSLFTKLAARLPGPDVTREQLRDGSWWEGPHALVVVDDHDLVAAPSGDPVAQLLDLLPVARDVGLHVVLARAAGGAMVGMTTPVVRRLRELGTPGLLLSGSPEEGTVLHGARLRALPPGRALLARRQDPPELVQIVWTPEDGA